MVCISYAVCSKGSRRSEPAVIYQCDQNVRKSWNTPKGQRALCQRTQHYSNSQLAQYVRSNWCIQTSIEQEREGFRGGLYVRSQQKSLLLKSFELPKLSATMGFYAQQACKAHLSSVQARAITSHTSSKPRPRARPCLLVRAEAQDNEQITPSVETSTPSAPQQQVAPPTPPQPAGNKGLLAGSAVGFGAGLFIALRLAAGGASFAALEADSIPLDAALGNGRPTVLEFYADWCEVRLSVQREVATHTCNF